MRNLNHRRFAQPRRQENETVVQNCLSYTPSQMLSMTEQGIAVSSQNQNPDLFFDGVPMNEGTFDVPLYKQRGIDVADCWQAETSIKKKAKDGLKKDIKLFGKNPQSKGGE